MRPVRRTLRPVRRTLAVLAAITALGAGSIGLAEGARVIIIGPSPKHPTVVHVRNELQVLGLEVEVLTPGTGASDLAVIGRRRKAVAVARVEDWPPEVIVWVDPARQLGQPSKGSEIRVSESLSGPAEPGLLALRAIELLRGKLIPVTPGEPAQGGGARAGAPGAPTGDAALEDAPPDAEAGATADTASDANPSISSSSPPQPRAGSHAPADRAQVSGFLAGAALLSPGGVPITPQIRVGAGWSPHARLGFEALAFFPTAPATLSVPEGTIELRALGFGGGPFARLTEPTADLSVTATAGIGAMVLLFEGSAPSPFVALEGSRWTALPYVGAGLSYALHPLFGLRADMIAAITLPEPVIRAAAREVASMGRPALLFSVGIEVRP